jgi:hypothetical protein
MKQLAIKSSITMKSTQKQRPEKDVTTIIAKLSKDGLIRLK